MQTTRGHHTLRTGTIRTEVITLIITQLHGGKLVVAARATLNLIPLFQLIQSDVKWCALGILHTLHEGSFGNVIFQRLDNQIVGALRLLLVVSLVVIFIIELLQAITVLLIPFHHISNDVLQRLLRTYDQTAAAQIALLIVDIHETELSGVSR